MMAPVVCLTCKRLGVTCADCVVRALRHRSRGRWQDGYKTGDRVEVLLFLSDGPCWVGGTVVRTLRSNGNPVVSVDGSRRFDWCVIRKSEIRKELDETRRTK